MVKSLSFLYVRGNTRLPNSRLEKESLVSVSHIYANIFAPSQKKPFASSEISEYYVINIDREPSRFRSGTNCITDPPRRFSDS